MNTQSIFSAFLDCPHKAFLEIHGQPGREETLEFSINKRFVAYRDVALQRYQQSAHDTTQSLMRWVGFNRNSDDKLVAAEAGVNSEILMEYLRFRMKKKRVASSKRQESGLDKFLRESMAEDVQFRARFLAEAKKLPRDTQKRVLRKLQKN